MEYKNKNNTTKEEKLTLGGKLLKERFFQKSGTLSLNEVIFLDGEFSERSGDKEVSARVILDKFNKKFDQKRSIRAMQKYMSIWKKALKDEKEEFKEDKDHIIHKLKFFTEKEIFEFYNKSPNIYNLTQYGMTESEIGNSYFKTVFRIKSLTESPIVISIDGGKIQNINIPEVEKITVGETDLIVLPLFDFHLGASGSNKITGENVTLKDQFRWLKRIFSQTINFSKNGMDLLLPIGQDLFNMDNSIGTTAGTPQPSSQFNHYLDVLEKSLPIYISFIKTLIEKGVRVNVVWSPGNHDYNISRSFYTALLSTFHSPFSSEEVKSMVIPWSNENFSSRQYFQKEEVGIMMFHGDNSDKKKGVPREMFEREAWNIYSTSKLLVSLEGHLHIEQVTIDSGLIRYRIPSCSPMSDWGHKNAYLGGIRYAQLFKFDSKSGLNMGVDYLNVCMPGEKKETDKEMRKNAFLPRVSHF